MNPADGACKRLVEDLPQQLSGDPAALELMHHPALADHLVKLHADLPDKPAKNRIALVVRQGSRAEPPHVTLAVQHLTVETPALRNQACSRLHRQRPLTVPT